MPALHVDRVRTLAQVTLVSAIAFIGYLKTRRDLRTWMPFFLCGSCDS